MAIQAWEVREQRGMLRSPRGIVCVRLRLQLLLVALLLVGHERHGLINVPQVGLCAYKATQRWDATCREPEQAAVAWVGQIERWEAAARPQACLL